MMETFTGSCLDHISWLGGEKMKDVPNTDKAAASRIASNMPHKKCGCFCIHVAPIFLH